MEATFGFDRYALAENRSRMPVRAWRCSCCSGLYKAKTARDALDGARYDAPWKDIRSEDLSEVPMADILQAEGAQARAQAPNAQKGGR